MLPVMVPADLHCSIHRSWSQQSPQDQSIYHKEQQQNYVSASTADRNTIRPAIFIAGFILFYTVAESYQLHLWKCDVINQGLPYTKMKMKCSAFCLKAKFIFIWSGSTIQRAQIVPEKDTIRAKNMLAGERSGMY